MRNDVSFRIMGKYALFTGSVSKTGGEKSALLIPTYQSLIDVIESMYWKLSLVYYIDEVCVVKPTRTETKGIRPIKYGGGNNLAYDTYLYDVEYIVKVLYAETIRQLHTDGEDDLNQQRQKLQQEEKYS